MRFLTEPLNERQIAAARRKTERVLANRFKEHPGDYRKFFILMDRRARRGEHQIVLPLHDAVPRMKRRFVVKFIAENAVEPAGKRYHEVSGDVDKSYRQEANAAVFRSLKFPVVVHHLIPIQNPRGPPHYAVISEDVTRDGWKLQEAHSCDFSQYRNGTKLQRDFENFVGIMHGFWKQRTLMYDAHRGVDEGPVVAFRKTFYVVHDPRKPKFGHLVMGDLDHVHFTSEAVQQPRIRDAIQEPQAVLMDGVARTESGEEPDHPRFKTDPVGSSRRLKRQRRLNP